MIPSILKMGIYGLWNICGAVKIHKLRLTQQSWNMQEVVISLSFCWAAYKCGGGVSGILVLAAYFISMQWLRLIQWSDRYIC